MDFFNGRLLYWYQQNKRELPWRQTSDPYAIWLSEVILQQTRVNQGIGYYSRMLQQWPDLPSLAQASEKDVLKMWQGLGYYSRARNLHHAAKQVVNEYNGKIPDTYEGLLKLKGVGKYTAAAVASIAFNQPVAVLDGNVARVLSRIFGLEEPIDSTNGVKQLSQLANGLLDTTQPGDFNQAMMEFGALQCVPSNPDCGVCIFADKCTAFAEKKVEKLPVKAKKVLQRDRWFHFLIITNNIANDCSLLIEKRKNPDIWKSLYQFPLIETEGDVESVFIIESVEFQKIINKNPFWIVGSSGIIKHQLTHQRLFCRFHHFHVDSTLDYGAENGLSLVALSELDHYPLPRIIDRYLEDGGRLAIDHNIKTTQNGGIK